MTLTFAERYCATHHLPAADFDRAVLRRILYPHARLLAPLIRVAQPDFFDADLDLVRTVGQIRHLRQFHDASTDYRHHLAHTSAARRFLRLRASARKLYHLAAHELATSSGDHPRGYTAPTSTHSAT